MDAEAVCDTSNAASSSATCKLLEVSTVAEESLCSAFISDQQEMESDEVDSPDSLPEQLMTSKAHKILTKFR